VPASSVGVVRSGARKQTVRRGSEHHPGAEGRFLVILSRPGFGVRALVRTLKSRIELPRRPKGRPWRGWPKRRESETQNDSCETAAHGHARGRAHGAMTSPRWELLTGRSHRHRPRVFQPDRKGPYWERRKLQGGSKDASMAVWASATLDGAARSPACRNRWSFVVPLLAFPARTGRPPSRIPGLLYTAPCR